jgi:signal transduction histidine kinase
MRRPLWVRFLAVSALFAIVLSLLYWSLIRVVAGASNEKVQRGMCLFLAKIVESSDYATSLRLIDSYRSESVALPMKAWVLSESGQILARNTGAAPPSGLSKLPLPAGVHEISTYARGLPSLPKYVVIRLQAPRPTFLILEDLWGQTRRVVVVESVIFVATLGTAVFLALSLLTLYLRARSKEAKQVIAAMKAGQLNARFTLGRFDALGQVMLDFNEMADEIERLVRQLRTAEGTRRELLQDLGHDLRTPLTSLRASAETLLTHRDDMSAQAQSEFVAVIRNELTYLQRLIEQLFFIAEMTEPNYANAALTVDLERVIGTEAQAVLASRQEGTETRLSIEFVNLLGHPSQRLVRGDAHLLSRLFRNAIENAATHANSSVRIEVSAHPGCLAVLIDDDGPGMSREAIEAFGRRRVQRVLPSAESSLASLGLGSVIIRAALTAHGGKLKIMSRLVGDPVRGTRLVCLFPLSARVTQDAAQAGSDGAW